MWFGSPGMNWKSLHNLNVDAKEWTVVSLYSKQCGRILFFVLDKCCAKSLALFSTPNSLFCADKSNLFLINWMGLKGLTLQVKSSLIAEFCCRVLYFDHPSILHVRIQCLRTTVYFRKCSQSAAMRWKVPDYLRYTILGPQGAYRERLHCRYRQPRLSLTPPVL